MRSCSSVSVFFVIIAGVLAACTSFESGSVPGSAQTGAGTSLPSAYTRQEANIAVTFLDKATVQSMWGKKWQTNPFLPYESTFLGKKFELYPLSIKAHTGVAVVIASVRGSAEGKPLDGRAYGKNEFVDFWQTFTADDDTVEWEKKKRAIERTVPYLGSDMPLYAGTTYVVPYVVPPKSPRPDTIVVELIIDGKLKEYTINL